MTSPAAPGLRPHVIAAKQRLAEGREKLKARHQRGALGVQICRAQTELFDSIVLSLYQNALDEFGPDKATALQRSVALVPHGGYGRGDVAPFSDVDLMILHTPDAVSIVDRLIEQLVRDVYDVGLVLGQSIRTPKEACQLARADATICTSLIESRMLTGSQELYDSYWEQFQRITRRNASSLMTSIELARDEERAQFGETVYLLEPNVKRSPGGLRDLQLMRWVGSVRYGSVDADSLKLQGLLSRQDHESIQKTREFLLRLRNEMHFHSGKPNDHLDRSEQLRLAELYGFHDTQGLLAVEQFMKQYFLLTQETQKVVTQFLTAARGSNPVVRWLSPLVSHQFEGDFRIGPQHIRLTRRGLAKMSESLSQILRLFDVANLYDKPIEPKTLYQLRDVVPLVPLEMSDDAGQRFLSLLNQPARLGEMLRQLRDLGVLERLVPAFAHARCLLQFNAYHKYTVDEHSIRAVEAATQFARDSGPLGNVYRQLKRKWMLHLALLLHDLGKGFAEDHSEVGVRIAEDVAKRFNLNEADTETLKFLVHKHLYMSHIAFRRDTSDKELIVRFAVEVGSAEVLEMLFLLTASDLAAVGPGVLNAWKIEVLADLFHSTMQHLSSDDPTLDYDAALEERRQQVLDQVAEHPNFEWFHRQVEALPSMYLRTATPEVVAEDLAHLRTLSTSDAIARGRYLPESGTVEYRIGTYENITPGVFHKLAGAITSQGLQILTADITTLADGLIFDRFFVRDPDFPEEPPASRIEQVCKTLVTSLKQPDGQQPTFRRLWRSSEQRRHESLSPLPTQVRIDNSTSDRCTIIDVFAADRMGLLYAISRTLFELNLSVSVAKIGTYLDQVVDVFYVTDRDGRKVDDDARRQRIRSCILEEIARLEQEEAEKANAW